MTHYKNDLEIKKYMQKMCEKYNINSIYAHFTNGRLIFFKKFEDGEIIEFEKR